MALVLKDNRGEDVNLDDVLDENFSDAELQNGLLCSDFDHTMIDRDFGFLLFLEKLSDPKFWTMSVSHFRRILLPKAYDQMISSGATCSMSVGSNGGSELNSDDCISILMLRDDIVELFALIKEVSRKDPAYLHIGDPLLNEFARKMSAFDKLLIKIDGVLMQQMDGRLLSRTRFFARKRKSDIKNLTERAISRTVDDNLTLAVHDINQGVFHQYVRRSDLKDLYVNRSISIVDDTRRIIARAVRRGVLASVVTTNLTDIVSTFIQESPYKPLISTVEGSTLAEYEGTDFLRPTMKGKPVIASEKEKVALRLQEEFNRRLIIAIGDSVRGDGYMGVRSLMNGGIFVAVGKKYEDTKGKFEPVVRKANEFGVTDVDKKVLYVSRGNGSNGGNGG